MNEQRFTKQVIDTDLWYIVKIKDNGRELNDDELVDCLNSFHKENQLLKDTIENLNGDVEYYRELLTKLVPKHILEEAEYL